MPNDPITSQSDDELRSTAENLIAAHLAKGPVVYGLHIDIKTYQELVWEAWSAKYIDDVRSQLSKLSNKMLETIDAVVETMIDKKEFQKPMRPKRKSNLN